MFRWKKKDPTPPEPDNTADVLAGLGMNRNDLAGTIRNEDIRRTLEDIRDTNKEILELLREYVNQQT